MYNIPNTKVVLHVKPVDKFKAIKRIDKCIGEMETKQIMSEKASEANSAETHRETMHALLDSLQTENESLLDVTLTITAYNYLDDENYKKSVRRNIMTGNFKPSNLYGLQIEGLSRRQSLRFHLKNITSAASSAPAGGIFPFVKRSLWTRAAYARREQSERLSVSSSTCGKRQPVSELKWYDYR